MEHLTISKFTRSDLRAVTQRVRNSKKRFIKFDFFFRRKRNGSHQIPKIREPITIRRKYKEWTPVRQGEIVLQKWRQIQRIFCRRIGTWIWRVHLFCRQRI